MATEINRGYDSINKKNTILNIIKVAISNIIKLLSGVVVGFLLPKIIGINDYAFYKTFTLYATYVGIFQFGFEDGIYLKYGGVKYTDIDKSRFRMYTKLLFGTQLFIAIIFSFVVFFTFTGDLKFIFLSISAYLILYNMTVYYQFISQITGRFGELSFRNMIQSTLTIIAIIVLWYSNFFLDITISYKIYIILFILIQGILTIWYIYTYSDISFGKSLSIKEEIEEVINLVKLGIPLMIANLCLILILNIDRQFVNILFPIEIYAIYAFAYNMLSLITTATSAISTVLYPTLKRINIDSLKKYYEKLISLILVFVFLCISVYFPLSCFVKIFLPKYKEAIVIFRIILPGLACSATISIIIHNYYKIINKNVKFFRISIVVLFLSVIANYFAYKLFKSTEAISIASIIVLIIWYFISNFYFIKVYQVKWLRNTLFLSCSICIFYILSGVGNALIGFISYLIAEVILIVVVYNKAMYSLLKKYIHH